MRHLNKFHQTTHSVPIAIHPITLHTARKQAVMGSLHISSKNWPEAQTHGVNVQLLVHS